MNDLEIPTNQFHSYQPPEATPASDQMVEAGNGRLSGLLQRFGLTPSVTSSMRSMTDKIGSVDLTGSVERVRGYARKNPAKVLGGIAAVAIGAGLLRQRRMS
jgi:hypothetical protein